jgi:hypothetical protein
MNPGLTNANFTAFMKVSNGGYFVEKEYPNSPIHVTTPNPPHSE